MLSFVSYFTYVYIALPLVYRFGFIQIYKKYWYDICPLIKCIQPLTKCLKEIECKNWLDDMAQCNDPNSTLRKNSSQKFSFVQHPYDPAYCHYSSFDSMTTYTSIELLDCIGNSGCLKPSLYTDECATITPKSVLPFDSIPSNLLKGKWKKLYTTGWDIWPCQYTEFSSPHNDNNNTTNINKEPESWMTNWPTSDDVWRMDLYWKNNLDHGNNITFHMCNEMYPGKYWDFSSLQQQNEEEEKGEQQQQQDQDDTTTTTTTTPSKAKATLKTRAIMWGTEAHENWYLLDIDLDLQIIMIYYCAHTSAVNRFDSMTMVLQKIDNDHDIDIDDDFVVDDDYTDNTGINDDDDHDDDMTMRMVMGSSSNPQQQQLTEEQRQNIEMKAIEILGEKHGKLQRIDECH